MNRQLQLSPLGLAAMFAAATISPISPAEAFVINEFQYCAANLIGIGVSKEQTATACAQALHPKELSLCALNIYDGTGTKIDGPTALSSCFRVRRPLELSQCVTSINQYTREPALPDVLDYCRRSLLPIRFSDCVVGLSIRIQDLTPGKAMDTCISAFDWPNELYPTVVPNATP